MYTEILTPHMHVPDLWWTRVEYFCVYPWMPTYSIYRCNALTDLRQWPYRQCFGCSDGGSWWWRLVVLNPNASSRFYDIVYRGVQGVITIFTWVNFQRHGWSAATSLLFMYNIFVHLQYALVFVCLYAWETQLFVKNHIWWCSYKWIVHVGT